MVKKKKATERMAIGHDDQSMVTDQFRAICTNILNIADKRNIRSVLLTSPVQKDGKTTMAANLALLFTEQEKTVLLIDGNFRDPAIHEAFHLSNSVGLSNVLNGEVTLEEAIVPSSMVDNLSILPSGPLPSHPVKLLTSPETRNMMEKVNEMFDFVLIDSPSLLAVCDAQIVYRYVDGVVLVVSNRKTELQQAIKAKNIIQHMDDEDGSHSKLLGVIFNRTDKNPYYY